RPTGPRPTRPGPTRRGPTRLRRTRSGDAAGGPEHLPGVPRAPGAEPHRACTADGSAGSHGARPARLDARPAPHWRRHPLRRRGPALADGPRGVRPACGPAALRVLGARSPAGEVSTQATARELSAREHLVFACGRYEAIDQRVADWPSERMEVRPMSIGDYVLNGGEVAVLVMVEAIARLLPGVRSEEHTSELQSR